MVDRIEKETAEGGENMQLSEEEKKKAISDLKRMAEKVPELKILKDVQSEEDIVEIWKNNLMKLKVPVVIQYGRYVYGIGGIMKTGTELYMDEDVFKYPFVYKSLIHTQGYVRDIFYFFVRCWNTIAYKKDRFPLLSIISRECERLKAKKYYDEKVNILKLQQDEKGEIALLLQAFYAGAESPDDIHKLYEKIICNYNSCILTSGETSGLEDRFKEEYDVFFISYKKDNQLCNECFIITRFGVFKDLCYNDNVVQDPVKRLSEIIKDNLKVDQIFEEWITKQTEKYINAPLMEDKIYEFIMENEELEDCEFKREFTGSCLLVNAFDKLLKDSYFSEEKESLKKIIKLMGNNIRENMFQLIMLINGFDLSSVKIDPAKLTPKGLIKSLEGEKKRLSGARPSYEEKEVYGSSVAKMIKDFEFFFTCFLPFYIIYKNTGDNNFIDKDILEKLKEKYLQYFKDNNKGGKKINKLTLGDKIGLYKYYFKNDEIFNYLDNVNTIRNNISHQKDLKEFEVNKNIFEQLQEYLRQIYEKIDKLDFHVIKIIHKVEDSNGRKFVVAREYEEDGENKHCKKWYLTFEEERVFDDLDPTYLYFMVPKSNPITRNPIIVPVNIGFELEEYVELNSDNK
jgi:hypothetical protein